MATELVFDIGMHRGEDTAFYLRKGYRVAGFEANPRHVEHCRIRFAEEIARGDLIIVLGALRDTSETRPTEFFINEAHSDWGTIDPEWRDRNAVAFRSPSKTVLAPTVSLAAVVDQLGTPLFAKIDVEGADAEILAGLRRLSAVPRFLSTESAKGSWDDLEVELTTLFAMGYRRFKAVQQRTIPGSTIATRDLQGRRLRHTFERFASGPFGDDLTGWQDIDGVRKAYERIFRDYKRWGDTSWLQRRVGRRPIAALQLIAGRPLPGWYDTHARLD